MQSKIIAFNEAQRTQLQDFRAGDVVKVHRKIKEGNKERIQIFEGMVIAIKGRQSSSPTMTIRKVSKGGYGVEIIVPVLSPNVAKIDLVKRAKVRRSKLYYIRDKAAKALRFKFTDGSEVITEEFAEAAKEEEQKEAAATQAAEDTSDQEENAEANMKKGAEKTEDAPQVKEKEQKEAAEEAPKKDEK